MNKQKFVEYLRKPSELNAKSLIQLESLIEEHPYFQSARTLLAKGSKQLNPKKAGHHINLAAIYATDRILLKRYINDELIFLSPLQVHESHEADHDRDISEVIKTNKIVSAQVKATQESKVAPKKQRITPPKEDDSELLEAPNPSELDHLIEDIYREMEDLKVNRAKFNQIESKLAEDEEVDEAVNEALERAAKKVASKTEEATAPKEPEEEKPISTELPIVTEEPEIEPSNTEKPVASKTTAEKSINTDTSEATEEPKNQEQPKRTKKVAETEIKKKPLPKTKQAPKVVKEKKKPIEATTKKEAQKDPPKTSTGSVGEKPTENDEKKDIVLKKPSLSRSARVRKPAEKADTTKTEKPDSSEKAAKTTSTSDTNDEPDKKEPKENSNRSKQSEIIASFIKNNPTISPADPSQPKTNSDLSSHSTELHPEIASEYLAEIYLKQGRTERALQIYEALIVKFPEKSVYFADIIKKINEQS